MSCIGFDLDGVLVPDFDHVPLIGGLEEFYKMTTYILPLFRPTGNYYIITARLAEYKGLTLQWCEKYLSTNPVYLFHDKTTESSEEYKTYILNNNKHITTYVESDLEIVRYLKENVTSGCEIIHFADFLQKHFMSSM